MQHILTHAPPRMVEELGHIPPLVHYLAQQYQLYIQHILTHACTPQNGGGARPHSSTGSLSSPAVSVVYSTHSHTCTPRMAEELGHIPPLVHYLAQECEITTVSGMVTTSLPLAAADWFNDAKSSTMDGHTQARVSRLAVRIILYLFRHHHTVRNARNSSKIADTMCRVNRIQVYSNKAACCMYRKPTLTV